jgi:hypothetical protein
LPNFKIKVKLPGEAKLNILPPECGQPIDGVKLPSQNLGKNEDSCKNAANSFPLQLMAWMDGYRQLYVGVM